MREALTLALAALQIGRDAAEQVASEYHASMHGYRPASHQEKDDDVAKVDAAIAACEAALADQPEPVACIARNASGQIHMNDWHGQPFDMSKHVGALLYAAPSEQKDAARLDWLDKTGREEGHGFCHTNYGEYRHYVHATHRDHLYPSARETIDAAMKGTT